MRVPRLLAALAATLTAGCGGTHAPTDLIRVKMVAMAEVAEREVTIKPDGDGATVEVREVREPQDIRDKTAKVLETKRAARLSEADYRALWKSFPGGKTWTLKDAKPGGHMHSLPVYHLELSLADRKVKAVVEGPELLEDKAPMEVIQAVWKAAGVK